MKLGRYQERPPKVVESTADDRVVEASPDGVQPARVSSAAYDETTPVYRDTVPAASVDETVAERRTGSRYMDSASTRVNTLLFAVLAMLEGLLGLRFLLLAFGANSRSSFVNFIYDVSWPFVRPFSNAFSDRTWDQGIVEPSTLLAIGVYLLAFVLLTLLVSALLPHDTDSGETVRRRRRVTHAE